MKGKKTIVFGSNGMIQPQNKEVQEALDQSIVGESELTNGGKFFISSKVENEQRTLTILKSQKNGIIDKQFDIPDFIGQVKGNLDEYLQDKKLFKNHKKLEQAQSYIEAQQRLIKEQKLTAEVTKYPLRNRKANEKIKEAETKLDKLTKSIAND